jgi:hypothetical protein
MGNISNPENWVARERLRFIERAVFWRGWLQREEMARVFGLSVQQCSADLQRYQELNPGALVYTLNRKRYEGAPAMKCALHEPRLEEAMATFLEDARSWQTQPCSVWSGGGSKVVRVELPRREAGLEVQRRMFLSVLHGKRVRIHYLSMNSPKASWRWIRPHAFGNDGYRWHVRAWNEETEDFRDFVLSRMQSADWPEEDVFPPAPDTAWETWETLSLVPNPELSAEHQAAVGEDFGLKSGKLTLKVRQAMLPYTLDHLRLPNGRWEGKPFLVPDGK